MNYVPIVVATDLEVAFFCSKEGGVQYFCLLVLWWWVFGSRSAFTVTPEVLKLGLGLGFMQDGQVLPHWLNQSFSFWTLPYTQRHCHVRIEKGPVQTVAIMLEAHNSLEYHYML